MGAYTISGAVEFNGLPYGKPIYFMSKQFWWASSETRGSWSTSLVLGIRSKPPFNQHNENVNSIHIRFVSIQAIVRTKSRMTCCHGCSKISRKKPPWLAYNKCCKWINSCSHLSLSISILEHLYYISTNRSVSWWRVPVLCWLHRIRSVEFLSSLPLSLLLAYCQFFFSFFSLREWFLFYWMRMRLNCSSLSLILSFPFSSL